MPFPTVKTPRPEERAGGGWQPGHGGLGAAERCGLRPPPSGAAGAAALEARLLLAVH